MEVVRLIVEILLIIDCVILTIVVLKQEAKQSGLGSIGGGAAETYFGKNKGRTKEGLLVKITIVLLIVFFLAAFFLNVKAFM